MALAWVRGKRHDLKITTALAWVCVAVLILYPVSAILVWAYLTSNDNYGVLAALLAANAGTAFLVRLVLDLPEFSDYTSEVLRLIVLLIAAFSGLLSAVNWMADEVDHLWLRVVIISPVVVILLVLRWFVNKVNIDKEGTKHEGG